ncbi:hypothetical protein HHX38_28735 [Streptomyces sp. PKU-MA01144]|uniref:hypothetical protein n=1 Tax=Streptomyces sp. PKU-MA01144 TaxID=2729138 RepID=UPI001479BD3E|nr:hypothetical protein [Streptomyces sp. PKU-MA01144]NNJ08086.1 hypothetical protein [Streptomyces sp. PKU-MA01144]
MTPEREEPRTPELEALLAAARRPGAPDPAARESALAAFRTARDAGLHAAPVPWWRRRGRDDWRPAAERRRGRLLVRGLIAGIVAAWLGGMAVAAGTGAIPSPFGGGEEPGPGRSPEPTRTRQMERVPTQTPGFPVTPSQTPAGATEPGPQPGATVPAAADVALCRAYLAALEREGVPPRGEAMARLEARAGGPEAARAWCEGLLLTVERQPPGHGTGQGGGPKGEPGAGQPSTAPGGIPAGEQGRPTAPGVSAGRGGMGTQGLGTGGSEA